MSEDTGRRTLFLVDDEPHVLSLLGRLFTRAGFTVHTFESAEAASARLDELRPDVVVCDRSMPTGDGVDFLRELRRSHPALRSVLITGGPVDEAVRDAMARGDADALVTKPWNNVTFIELVRKLAG